MEKEQSFGGQYVCDRCGEAFSSPQALRDHEDAHTSAGDEEVEEEWEHGPTEPKLDAPFLGPDSAG